MHPRKAPKKGRFVRQFDAAAPGRRYTTP